MIRRCSAKFGLRGVRVGEASHTRSHVDCDFSWGIRFLPLLMKVEGDRRWRHCPSRSGARRHGQARCHRVERGRGAPSLPARDSSNLGNMRFSSSGFWQSRTPKRVVAPVDVRINQGELLASNDHTRKNEVTMCWSGNACKVFWEHRLRLCLQRHCQLAIVHGRSRSDQCSGQDSCILGSWADSMKIVKEHHPTIANELMVGIDREEGPCFQSVRLVDAGFSSRRGQSWLTHFLEQSWTRSQTNPRQQRAARQLHEHRREVVQVHMWAPTLTLLATIALRAEERDFGQEGVRI